MSDFFFGSVVGGIVGSFTFALLGWLQHDYPCRAVCDHQSGIEVDHYAIEDDGTCLCPGDTFEHRKERP